MRLGILRDDAFAYLLRAEAILRLQAIGEKRFFYADGATCGMIIREACMQALVAEAFIAIAIARKLRDGFGNLPDSLISQARLPHETLRGERGRQTARGNRRLEGRDARRVVIMAVVRRRLLLRARGVRSGRRCGQRVTTALPGDGRHRREREKRDDCQESFRLHQNLIPHQIASLNRQSLVFCRRQRIELKPSAAVTTVEECDPNSRR